MSAHGVRALPAMTWFRRKRTREAALVVCFLLPSLAIFLLYRILPLGWNAVLSFQSWSPLKAAQLIGLEHYEEMLLDDDVFWQALANTLIFIACSPLAIAAGARHRAAGQQRPRGAAVYRTIVFLSYPLMTVAVGIIWRWLYDERGGFINYVAALERAGRPAGQVPAELRLGAALRDRWPTSGRCSAST